MNYDKNFENVVNYIFRSEGGFSNRKNDLGGRTNMGVTQVTYNNWRKKKGLMPKDVKEITKDEAKQLYYEEFWLPSGANKVDDLREGYLLFDTAVNSGPNEAKRLYEKSNGNVYQFLKDRKTYYDNLIERHPSQETFRAGWCNRLNDIEENMNNIIEKGYYKPEYYNDVTPFDKEYQGPLKNIEISNPKEFQNKKNKYQYLYNRNKITTGQAANIREFTPPYTRGDIKSMTPDEFSHYEKSIMSEMQKGKILNDTRTKSEINRQKHSTGSSASNDGKWVTINGNHVLIKE